MPLFKMEKFTFFLPTRKGSERVSNKNTRPFAGVEGGLLRIKLEQLLKTDEKFDIVLSTNDEESILIAEQFNNRRIKIIQRPEELCSSSTNLADLIRYIPSIITDGNIIWVHVTEPFVDHQVLTRAIEVFSEKKALGECDSLMSVNKIQSFLWSKEEATFVSHDRNMIRWPRSQDLTPLYEVNSAIFINSRENYLGHGDRIGNQPFLFELNKIQSIDIDWEDDFLFAELMYENTGKI